MASKVFLWGHSELTMILGTCTCQAMITGGHVYWFTCILHMLVSADREPCETLCIIGSRCMLHQILVQPCKPQINLCRFLQEPCIQHMLLMTIMLSGTGAVF